MNINYLGPAGTFSEQAAIWFKQQLHDDSGQLIANKSISDALRGSSGNDIAVVPYYNLIDGLVTETIDRLMQGSYKVSGALRIPIRIAAGHARNVSDDGAVYSHPKALSQCSDYLTKHHPNRKRIEVSSTAEGVVQAFENGGIALASSMAFDSADSVILTNDATNNYLGRTNYTEFLLVSRAEAKVEVGLPACDENRCLLVCDPQDDRSGLLAGMLGQIAFFHINLARLHVRPARGVTSTKLDPQVFILEIAGHIDDKNKSTVLGALSIGLSGSATSNPILLGDYPLFDLTQD